MSHDPDQSTEPDPTAEAVASEKKSELRSRITSKTHYRRLGRELAMQFLYQADISDRVFSADQLDLFWEQAETSGFFPLNRIYRRGKQFADLLIQGVLEHKKEIDSLIRQAADKWPLDRIAAVDRNIMRISIFEMRYIPVEVPPPVSINEAVEIAKIFADTDASAFINGILDRILNAPPELSEEDLAGNPNPQAPFVMPTIQSEADRLVALAESTPTEEWRDIVFPDPESKEESEVVETVEKSINLDEIPSDFTQPEEPAEVDRFDRLSGGKSSRSHRYFDEKPARKIRVDNPEERIAIESNFESIMNETVSTPVFAKDKSPVFAPRAENRPPRDRKPFGDRPARPYGDKPAFGDRKPFGDRPARPYGDKPAFGDRKPYGDRPARPYGDKPAFGDRKPYGDRPARPYGDKPAFGDRKPYGDRPARPYGDKPAFGDRKPYGDRPARPYGDKPAFGDRKPYGDRPARPYGDKPAFGDRKPYGDRPARPYGDKPAFGDRKPYGDRPARPYGDKPAFGDRKPYGDRPARPYGDKPAFGDRKPYGDRPARPYGDKPAFGDRKPYGDRPARPYGDKPAFGDRKPYGDRPARPYGDKPAFGDRKPYGDRPARPYGDKPAFGDRKPYGDRPARPYGDKPAFGDRKPYGDRPARPYGDKPAFGDRKPFGAPRKPFGDRPSFPRKPKED